MKIMFDLSWKQIPLALTSGWTVLLLLLPLLLLIPSKSDRVKIPFSVSTALPVKAQVTSGGDVPEGLTASDWQDVRAQILADSLRARLKEDGGYQAQNPVQGFLIDHTTSGTTRLASLAETADWSWGLTLRSVGGEAMSTDGPAWLTASDDTVTYHWNAWIREWWENREDGLKQWFGVQRRPERSAPDAPLVLRMAVSGDLYPVAQDEGLIFVAADSNAVLTYDGLLVWDSTGKEIPARMVVDGKELALVVDDARATYPLTIDPTVQQAYLKAANASVGDRFGQAVAISGDTVVVGAPRESNSTAGVNGNPDDDFLRYAGAAYVFVRNGSTWSQQAYLKASNPHTEAFFGSSVAISGNTVVIGAPDEDSAATGVNGNQVDRSANQAGAAYVFVRNGSTWSQQAYLKASNTDSGDRFGHSVAINENTIAVGAWGEDSSATGVNGSQGNDNAFRSGAAYVFVRNGSTWSQQAYLKASNTDDNDRFGSAVDISGNTIVVGAYLEDSRAPGVNGNQIDDSGSRTGAAYVFIRIGSAWIQQAYLKASNPDNFDDFGWSVAIDGNTIVIGAPGEDSIATGVNGSQGNATDTGDMVGAAYVFFRNGSSWSQQAYIKASNTDLTDEFGYSVVIDGNTIVVGAYREGSASTGINGNQANNSASGAGAAYVFGRSGNTWSQQAYLKASNTDGGDRFGWSVGTSGNTTVVGADMEDSTATTVNGNQGNSPGASVGAAYVYAGTALVDVIFRSGFE